VAGRFFIVKNGKNKNPSASAGVNFFFGNLSNIDLQNI
jgi:hypothetical protein